MANTTVYETGTNLENVHEVLQKLETFAAANGWTINRSVLGEAISDTVVPFDDSLQAGAIGAATSPWSSNFEGAWSITDGVLTSAADAGTNYHAQIDNTFAVGTLIEVEFEIITRTSGTLYVKFGSNTNRYTATGMRVHKFAYKIEAGGYLRFNTSDFIGSFRVISIKERVPSIELSLSRTGVGFFHLNSEIANTQERLANKGPYIKIKASDAFDPLLSWDEQLNASGASVTNGIDDYYHNGIFAYYFFGTDRHIYCVVESWQGEFSHFGFGISKKYFDFRGGNFVYGTDWRWDTYANNGGSDTYNGKPLGFKGMTHPASWNYYRADLLGETEHSWLHDNMNGEHSKLDRLYGTYYGYTSQYYEENTYYGTAPFDVVFLAGIDVNRYKYSLGEMEEYRRTFCKYIDPKTVLSISDEDWMVFPVKRKQLTTPEEYITNSNNYALAYYIGPST